MANDEPSRELHAAFNYYAIKYLVYIKTTNCIQKHTTVSSKNYFSYKIEHSKLIYMINEQLNSKKRKNKHW